MKRRRARKPRKYTTIGSFRVGKRSLRNKSDLQFIRSLWMMNRKRILEKEPGMTMGTLLNIWRLQFKPAGISRAVFVATYSRRETYVSREDRGLENIRTYFLRHDTATWKKILNDLDGRGMGSFKWVGRGIEGHYELTDASGNVIMKMYIIDYDQNGYPMDEPMVEVHRLNKRTGQWVKIN